jgi:hypothetical protein
MGGQHSRRVRRSRGRYPAIALAGGLVVAAAFVGRAAAEHPSPAHRSAPPTAAAAAAGARPVADAAPASSTAGSAPPGLPALSVTGVAATPRRFPAVPASIPIGVTIASIGVHSGLQPLGLLKDGSLQPPTKWGEAGWYAKGVLPGQVGPAVIAGHVDSTSGPAVFYRLRELRPGARVLIAERNGRSLTFVVDDVHIYPKSRFPTAAVYGPTPEPQLRLVTCTGDFDAAKHSYVDNLVVSAHLVS